MPKADGWAPKSAEPMDGSVKPFETDRDGTVLMEVARCEHCCMYITRRPQSADKRWVHDHTGITYCAR